MSIIPRFLSENLRKAATQYPVISLTGPRQSGKTTLVRYVFPNLKYISLENPDQRQFATEDPKGFLRQFDSGVILDEVQRSPDLFSYIQTIVDEDDRPGRYILTGSQNFLLIEKISQSLAGRTAMLYLMPFSKRELHDEPPLKPNAIPEILDHQKDEIKFWDMAFSGFYPRIHDKSLEAQEWLSNYFQTYIERDVRSVINVGDLDTFGKFVRLCAGRVGQLVNYTSLAADCGISNMTAKRWLSLLRASFIIMPVQPHFANFTKRQIKSPKLYFLDTGLLIFLLGIRSPQELPYHAQKGAIFESFVFAEMYKVYLNNGLIPAIYFWQDAKKNEVDFILDRGNRQLPIEVKSGETISSDQFRGLKHFRHITKGFSDRPTLIYTGSESFIRDGIQVLSWRSL